MTLFAVFDTATDAGRSAECAHKRRIAALRAFASKSPENSAMMKEASVALRLGTGRSWSMFTEEEVKRLHTDTFLRSLARMNEKRKEEDREKYPPPVHTPEELAEFDRYVAWLFDKTETP